MLVESFKVESPSVKYEEDHILSAFSYETTEVNCEVKNGQFDWTFKPTTTTVEFKTSRKVPKLG